MKPILDLPLDLGILSAKSQGYLVLGFDFAFRLQMLTFFLKDRERQEIRRNTQKHPSKYPKQRPPAKTLAPTRKLYSHSQSKFLKLNGSG